MTEDGSQITKKGGILNFYAIPSSQYHQLQWQSVPFIFKIVHLLSL